MIKHFYKGWEIVKVGKRAYFASSENYHLAPQTFKLLRHAKEAIDNGEAALSDAEWKAKKIIQDIKLDGRQIKLSKYLAYRGNRAHQIALQFLNIEHYGLNRSVTNVRSTY